MSDTKPARKPAEGSGMTAEEIYDGQESFNFTQESQLSFRRILEFADYCLAQYRRGQGAPNVDDLLPATFYADRDIRFRVGRLVEQWRAAVAAVNSQLEEIAALRGQGAETREKPSS